MKILLFFSLLCACMNSYGQAGSPLWERLKKAELVEDAYRENFDYLTGKVIQEDVSALPPSEIIKYLGYLKIWEWFPREEMVNAGTSILFSKPDPDSLEGKMPEIRKDLAIFLENLKQASLISPRVHEKFLELIEANEFGGEAHLLSDLQPAVFLEEALAPGKILPLVNGLVYYQVLSPRQEAQLKAAIEQGEIDSYSHILSAIPRTAAFDSEFRGSLRLDQLDSVYQAVASLIPNFSFEGLRIDLETEKKEEGIEGQVESYEEVFAVLSTTSQDRVYTSKSSFGVRLNEEPLDAMKGEIDLFDHFEILNQFLADLQSPYRVNKLTFTIPSASYDRLDKDIENQKFGVLVATEEELDTIKSAARGYFKFYPVDYRHTWTDEQIEEVLFNVKNIGLISPSSADEERLLFKQVKATAPKDIIDMIASIPGLTFPIEVYHNFEVYPTDSIFCALIQLSQGNLKVGEIAVDFVEQGDDSYLSLTFSSLGKKYTWDLDYTYLYGSAKLMEKLNQLLTEQNHTGRYYLVKGGIVGNMILFLEPEQKKGLESFQFPNLHLVSSIGK